MSTSTGLTRAFRHRAFVSLWLGRTISIFGDSVHRMALVWWVMQETGSGLAMGTVMTCSLLPMIPLLLVGGAVVDRFDPVRLMLYVDVVRGVLTGVIAYLIAVDQLELWHLYVFAALFGVVSSFFYPASAKVQQSHVPKEDRPSANSLMSLSAQGASIIGPMVAAVVISIGQSALAFALDSATFAISTLCLLPLLRRSPKPEEQEAEAPSSVIADVLEGMKYVRSQPWLWISIVAFFVVTPTLNPVFGIVMPYMITQVNHQGASVLAVVESVAAAGTIAAGVLLGRRTHLSKRGYLLYGGVIALGAMAVLYGIPLATYQLAALSAATGFGLSLIMLVWMNLMQDRVPAEKFGRVASIDMMGGMVTQPIGMALIGWGIDEVVPLAICAIAGGLCMLAGILALLHPRIREID